MDARSIERTADQARVALRRGDPDEAIHLAERVLAERARHAGALATLGTANVLRGRTKEGISALRSAARAARKDPDVHCELGAGLLGVGDYDDAIAAYDAALRIDRRHRRAMIGKAQVLERRGESDAALRLLDRLASFSGSPDEDPPATAIRASILDRGDDAARTEAARLATTVVERPDAPASLRRSMGFLLGRAADRRGDVDTAFARLSAANAIGRVPFDRRLIADGLAAVRRVFDASRHATRPTATIPTRRPLFIVGLPRSGSTLLETMLDAHPRVHGGGELPHFTMARRRVPELSGIAYPDGWSRLTADDLDRVAASYLAHLQTTADDAGCGDVALVVDKALENVLHLGALDRLLPEAIIVHVSRDRLDAGLSAWMQNLIPTIHPWASDLGDCGWYVRQVEQHVAHWRDVLGDRILDVRYEDLVADPETGIRRVLAHAGLELDPACLRFHESRRDVATASYAQVAEPIHRRAVGRAEHFRAHLGPLIDALGPAPDASAE